MPRLQSFKAFRTILTTWFIELKPFKAFLLPFLMKWEGKEHKDRLLGKYELGKLIGRGAFAKVYQATDIQTGNIVAIKSISKRQVLKAGLVSNIIKEISIMRRMCHPHVSKLFEVLATKTKIHLVMEFAKGGELFAKLSKGRFSEDLSRRYFQQLISAVNYCHSRGVFHRDLKPENILLDNNWDLKVTDFGLSAVVNDQMQADGMLHTMCGTPAYVAPEILTKTGYEGAKTDIWSCGVILYVLNAGYLPFSDSNIMEMYRKIYKGQFRCPKWTSPDLKWLLLKLLDPNPNTRITVDEILRDPWFNKGQNEIRFQKEDVGSRSYKVEDNTKFCLNAFDIISHSSGYDLSGLISSPDVSVSGERFVSAKAAEVILEMVEGVAKNEGVMVRKKKEWGMRLEEKDGKMVVNIEINKLTDKLIVVEIQKIEEVNVGASLKTWYHKLSPHLIGLVYQPDNTL